MRRESLLSALFALALAAVPLGCGDGAEAVTDPSKLAPLTEEQKQESREADAEVSEEENADPTLPVRGKKKVR